MEGITEADIMETAREFGEALASCEECQRVRHTQEALRKDREARELLLWVCV